MAFAFVICLTMAVQPVSQSPGSEALAIVPAPVQVRLNEGEFVISPQTRIVAGAAEAAEAEKLVDALAPALGYRLRTGATGNENTIVFSLLDSLADRLGDEGYRLEVTPGRIEISAAQPAGLFYGIQTVRQLLPPAVFRRAAVSGVTWSVPCVSIEDRPRFGWRGLLLDPARHFIPKSAVLEMIDAMALHKLNSLQLHLTDDQGWRIEIKKYPRLTEVGAWRKETLVGHRRDRPQRFDGRPHGGYYTQDDIREIVRYGADRHVNVLPEIEMPGHARAAISAYPELGCNPDRQLEPWTFWGVCPDIFAPTDHTIAFLQDVLTEVLELFPSKFIHIGGDEAVKDQWKASEAIQARIRELGLKDEDEMQSWFIHRMDAFLAERGRRLIGWDEILEGGLAPGATVMSWRGEAGGIAAAQAGHDVVMAPTSHTYLDHYQGPRESEPLAIRGMLLLENVYAWEPIPAELTAEQGRHVLGGQGQLWGEYMPNARHIQYMAFPRACALAEVLWSPKEQRDYSDFLARLRAHLQRLDVMDVNYRRQLERIDMPVRGISSHRGENRIHPENTLAAFREAIRVGAHQIELDVYLTDYGDLIVIHDRTVDRTTDGSGDVRRMRLEEIKKLDAGSWKDPRFAGERIPTLDEVLTMMPRNVWLNLHLKGGRELGAAVARKVVEHGRTHQAFLATGREAANGARSVHKDILIGNMDRQGGDVERYINDTIEHGDAFIQLHHRHNLPDRQQMQRLKDAGVRINFYGTDDPDALKGLYDLGVDFPLTDDLLPMMERAQQLGIDPVRPVYHVDVDRRSN